MSDRIALLEQRVAALEHPEARQAEAQSTIDSFIKEKIKEGMPYTEARRLAAHQHREEFNLVWPMHRLSLPKRGG